MLKYLYILSINVLLLIIISFNSLLPKQAFVNNIGFISKTNIDSKLVHDSLILDSFSGFLFSSIDVVEIEVLEDVYFRDSSDQSESFPSSNFDFLGDIPTPSKIKTTYLSQRLAGNTIPFYILYQQIKIC